MGKGNVVSLRAQEGPSMYLVGFFSPCFSSTVCQCPSGCEWAWNTWQWGL